MMASKTPYTKTHNPSGADENDIDWIDPSSDQGAIVIEKITMSFEQATVESTDFAITTRNLTSVTEVDSGISQKTAGKGPICLINADSTVGEIWLNGADGDAPFCSSGARIAAMADDVLLCTIDAVTISAIVFDFIGEHRIILKDKFREKKEGLYEGFVDVADSNGILGYGDNDGGDTYTNFFPDDATGYLTIVASGYSTDPRYIKKEVA